MTKVPLSQINVDANLPLGGVHSVEGAKSVEIRESSDPSAKKIKLEVANTGVLKIGDGVNPGVSVFDPVTGKLIQTALPTGSLTGVPTPTVTNTFLKASVGGGGAVSYLWDAASGGGGMASLSDDPSPNLAGPLTTGANKIQKGSAGTDSYIKFNTSNIELGTGAGVGYTIPTAGVGHKPAKMNSAGTALEFASVRAEDVSLAGTYTGNLQAADPNTVEELATAVDGLSVGANTLRIYDHCVGYRTLTLSGGSWTDATYGGWYIGAQTGGTISPRIGSAGVTIGSWEIAAYSGAGEFLTMFKSPIFYTGQKFKFKFKALMVEQPDKEVEIGLIGVTTEAGAATSHPEVDSSTHRRMTVRGTAAGAVGALTSQTWGWRVADGSGSSGGDVAGIPAGTWVEGEMSCDTPGEIKTTILNGSGNNPVISAGIPNNTWLFPCIWLGEGAKMQIDLFDLTIEI